MSSSCTSQAKHFWEQPHHFITQVHFAEATGSPKRHTISSIYSSPGGKGKREKE